jgi:hypothetical protein
MTDTPDSAFVDTCILLNYVNRYWERDKVSELLSADDVEHVISDAVAEEFETVCERRRDIYSEMVAFLLEQDDDITSFDPAERGLRTAGNDAEHIRTIQFELADTASDSREVLRLLCRFLRNLDDAVDKVMTEFVDRIADPCGPIMLSFRLADVVDNTADVRVLCDAAQWSADGGSGVFVTLDSTDIIDNEAAINATLEREQSGAWCLEIVLPADALTAGERTAKSD